MKWTKDLEKKLITTYPKTHNQELIIIFGVSEKALNSKAHRLGLVKDYMFLKETRGKTLIIRNKTLGRDLTYDLLKEIASKYKTRGEFQNSDSSAYVTARQKGLLDEICSHMAIVKFSIPQLILKDIMDYILSLESEYNTRKIIKPYEIDVYYPTLKLGFEYQGKLWHTEKYNNKRDLIKKEMCKANKITLIEIVENSRRYEEDIKAQLINNLRLINNVSNKKITKDTISNYCVGDIYSNIYNKDEILAKAKSYSSFKEFVKIEPNIYSKLIRMKLIDEATSHMGDKIRKHNIIEVKETIKKYVNLGDLIKNDYGTYLYIKRNKLDYLIKHLISKNERVNFTINEIISKIKNYKYICDFKSNNKRMYGYLKKHKLTHLLSDLVKCTGIKIKNY